MVVVLPLVPETRATCRPAENLSSASGSMARMAWPPTTEPDPRPVARERAPIPPPTAAASRVRSGRLRCAASRPAELEPTCDKRSLGEFDGDKAGGDKELWRRCAS